MVWRSFSAPGANSIACAALFLLVLVPLALAALAIALQHGGYVTGQGRFVEQWCRSATSIMPANSASTAASAMSRTFWRADTR